MHKTKDFLREFRKKVEKIKIIDTKFIEYIDDIFNGKSSKIFELLKKGISKYNYEPSGKTVWIAIGEEVTHIIYPGLYCNCRDFYKNVVILRKRPFCKHLLAQTISEVLKSYEEVTLDDSEYEKLIEDIKLDL